MEGSCPGEGKALGHARQHECDLLGIGLVNLVIHDEIERDSVQPGGGFGTISIEVLGGTKSEFNGAGRGHGSRKGCGQGWWWWWW